MSHQVCYPVDIYGQTTCGQIFHHVLGMSSLHACRKVDCQCWEFGVSSCQMIQGTVPWLAGWLIFTGNSASR